MLTSPIIHPQVLSGLARCGHKSQVLVSDAHFAVASHVSERAQVVHLALRAGAPSVEEVVAAVTLMVAVEAITSMTPSEPRWGEVARSVQRLAGGVEMEQVDREQFYRLSRSDDLALVLVTGDVRRFANVLLRIGVTGADQA